MLRLGAEAEHPPASAQQVRELSSVILGPVHETYAPVHETSHIHTAAGGLQRAELGRLEGFAG